MNQITGRAIAVVVALLLISVGVVYAGTTTTIGDFFAGGNITAKQIGGVIYADQYATIQDAINASDSNGDKISDYAIFVAPGNYTSRKQVHYDGWKNIYIYGTGNGSILYLDHPNNTALDPLLAAFYFTNSQLKISDVSVSGPISENSSNRSNGTFAFSVYDSDASFQNVKLTNLYNPIRSVRSTLRYEGGYIDDVIAGIAILDGNENHINRNTFKKSGDDMVALLVGSQGYTNQLDEVHDNTFNFTGVSKTSVASAIKIDGGGLSGIPLQQISIGGNVMNNSPVSGISILSSNVKLCSIYGNTINGSWSSGIGTSSGNCTISSNTISNSSAEGIMLNDGNANNIIIIGNNIYNNSGVGIRVFGSLSGNLISSNIIYENGGHGVSLESAMNTSVTGNLISRNGAKTTGQGIDISGTANWNVVNGNTILNNYNWGIVEAGTTSYNQITFNSLLSNPSGAASLSGTKRTQFQNWGLGGYNFGNSATAPTAFGMGDTYGNTTDYFEYRYNGTAWNAQTQNAYTELFIGNGATKNFSTTYKILGSSSNVYVNGTKQVVGASYDYQEFTQSVNLTSSPANNARVEVDYVQG